MPAIQPSFTKMFAISLMSDTPVGSLNLYRLPAYSRRVLKSALFGKNISWGTLFVGAFRSILGAHAVPDLNIRKKPKILIRIIEVVNLVNTLIFKCRIVYRQTWIRSLSNWDIFKISQCLEICTKQENQHRNQYFNDGLNVMPDL